MPSAATSLLRYSVKYFQKARLEQKIMSNNQVVLYTNPMSRGRIARWMLEEIGQPYKTVLLDYGTSMKAPEYLAINPMGKVPAITHNDAVVTENAAICAYLADAFPAAALAPVPNARAEYYRWLFYAAGPVEQAITNKSLGFEVPEGKSMMAGYGSFAAVMDVLEIAVRGKNFIVGDQFSTVDIILGSQIGFGLMFGSIEKRPEFERYWATLAARPARVRAEAIDNALMPART